MKPFVVFFALLVSSFAIAAEPPPIPNPFPVSPAVPNNPAPAPSPDAALSLPDEWLLIVKNDAEFILRASPKGKVDIVRAASPQIGGKFVGGNGKFSLETFKEKNVAIVLKRPGASGSVELTYSPAGAVDDSKDISRMVNLGNGPIPPPVTPVDPVAPPVAPFVLKSLRVILVYEAGDTSSAPTNSILSGKVVEDFLNATCTGGKAGWKRRDKDTAGQYDVAMQGVWDSVKSEFQPPINTKTPAAVIQVNDNITIVSFAATPAAMVALLKEYVDGKHAK